VRGTSLKSTILVLSPLPTNASACRKRSDDYRDLRYSRAMKLWPLLPLLTLSACSAQLTSDGHEVRLVDSLSPEDAKTHSTIGVVVASETYQHEGDEADCRKRLQNRAGRMGADLVVITQLTRHPCTIGQQSLCVAISGQALRKN
jgi:hypothetical protein